MAYKKIDNSILTNIAEAIRTKSETQTTYKPSEMPQAILDIPSGEGSGEIINKHAPLVLMDWEGTFLKSYSYEEVMALEVLPEPSSLSMYASVDHESLRFQEWNWNLVDIKEYVQNHRYGNLIVGANYITDDENNHDYFDNQRIIDSDKIRIQKRGSQTLNSLEHKDHCSLRNISIPNNITQIYSSAFNNCTCLKSIVLPKNTLLDSYVFYKCTSLSNISLPIDLGDMETNVFDGCRSLTSIVLPEKLRYINSYVFRDCISLTNVYLPKRISEIGMTAFSGCSSLVDILIVSKPSLSRTNAFNSISTNARFYVPRENLSWFETATNWSSIYTQYEFVAIEDYIDYCESLGWDIHEYQ